MSKNKAGRRGLSLGLRREQLPGLRGGLPLGRRQGISLRLRRGICYLVLALISAVCLFAFYILLINSTRAHSQIQKGFSLLPGTG